MHDGLIILDKPAGISSARAVTEVKRMLPRGQKIGHAGTLDPFATGVLILLLGKATQHCERIMSWSKTYEATIKFGATTASDDPDSPEERTATGQVKAPTQEELGEAIKSMIGVIEQVPPAYSAIKIRGRRACDRVRAGQASAELELKPRAVRIDAIELMAYRWPLAEIRVTCGRGTYIRSLARDLGKKLNVGGYVTKLRRTRIGQCGIESAAKLNQLNSENVAEKIWPMALIVDDSGE